MAEGRRIQLQPAICLQDGVWASGLSNCFRVSGFRLRVQGLGLPGLGFRFGSSGVVLRVRGLALSFKLRVSDRVERAKT